MNTEFRVIRIGRSNIAAISHHSNSGSLQIYKRAMMQLKKEYCRVGINDEGNLTKAIEKGGT